MNKYSLVRQKSTRPRADRDLYETPENLAYQSVERFLDDEGFGITERHLTCNWNILDPGCGKSAVWLSRASYACIWAAQDENIYPWTVGVDIEDNLINKWMDKFVCSDYLLFDGDSSKFDLIVGNPPFNKAQEFIIHSFDLLADNGYIYFFLRLAFLEGRKRQQTLFEKYPPKRVYVLTRRPSFFSTKNGKDTTDTLAYAMFLWQKGFTGKTELDWLYWTNDD